MRAADRLFNDAQAVISFGSNIVSSRLSRTLLEPSDLQDTKALPRDKIGQRTIPVAA
jgi:hypothetical protein